jgi:hypothetical protein
LIDVEVDRSSGGETGGSILGGRIPIEWEIQERRSGISYFAVTVQEQLKAGNLA